MDFRTRLKEEMEYAGIQHKELAEKADIKPRALLTYVSSKPSMPPADVAVRIAKVLGVTVEYLVDGSGADKTISVRTRQLLDNFESLSEREKAAVEKLVEMLHIPRN